ncbi:RasGEF domain containing protein [Histomonas meleagridis]|uniref:RasGEF domain containing protein n=1 Tax=Histomonas meleagridis TaxID=135588 RepID=UPI003559D273|nr:RasGEF domain containing protein [Histomonas meleagridis]KAH0799381.1 RasGEF domain containing protein [Histomonas meleagridis]
MSAPTHTTSNSLDTTTLQSKSLTPHAKAFLDTQEKPTQPQIQRPCLPISPEYDMVRENYFSKVDVDRSQWMAQLLQLNPEIKQFRERVLPLERAVEFGRLYLPDDRLVNHNVVLSLISQHLRTLGLVESQSSLHSEWDCPLNIPTSLDHSQIVLLIQRGIQHAERFWELTMDGTAPNDPDRKQLLEEISRVIGGAPVIQDNGKDLKSETPNDPQFITVVDGVLKSATLNQLIWICTTNSQYKTPDLISAVCLTYSSFTKAGILFSKLCERFKIAFAEPNWDDQRRSVELTFDFLHRWLRESGREMEDSVLSAIRTFVDKEIRPRFPNLCERLRDLDQPRSPDDYIDESRAPKVELGVRHTLWTEEFTLTSLPPVELARQLTMWTSRPFYSIKRSEFLDGSWDDPRRQHRSPNIVKITKKYDVAVSWFTINVLKPPQGFDRVGIISYFIKVAKKLYKMHNYLCCMWVLSAFNNPPLFRLKKTMAVVDKKKVQWLNDAVKKLLNFSDNFKVPIDISNNALAKNPKSPVLPALTCILSQLATYTAGVSAMSNNQQINVRRALEIFTYIQSIEKFQKERYCFLPIDQAQDLIEGLVKIDSDELDALSREVEPPN